jgi:hypothetical protein
VRRDRDARIGVDLSSASQSVIVAIAVSSTTRGQYKSPICLHI